ncbi:hypothetical protein ANCCEY_03853 [Ancylostoma ceylanicum]|uniref:Uncharacterized protein n=1 Tax=Ancylostoma ceylanicum TaxID=53326 RepID=A0A0D6LYV5_9BILA|nr:hypothetical protein ANCCEY_03853 [Ancylostoma ceylanicum]
MDKLLLIRVEDAMQYLKSLRNALPIVWWKSVCYHYVRKTRQVTRYRNGDAVPATQVYYERVDSHSAGNVFIYDVCGVKDISKSVLDLERFPLTRIRVTRGFVFACMQAAREFEQQRTRFFNENESRDDYMEVREGMDLSDVCLLEDMLVFRGSPPWFLRPSVFWIFSVLLLSWPLRIYAECRTAMLNYQVTKLFGTCYLSPSSVNYTGPLTRTSTMETVELEAALGREQYFVVPSYSEAMLMPHATVTLVDPSEARVYSRPIPVNNEQVVLRNYGAVDDELGHLPAIRPPRPLRSSRSMNFLQGMRRSGSLAACPRIKTLTGVNLNLQGLCPPSVTCDSPAVVPQWTTQAALAVLKPKSIVRLSSKTGKAHSECMMTQLCLSVPAGTAVVRRRRCWADRYFHELLLCGVASGSLITAVRETTSHFATAW